MKTKKKDDANGLFSRSLRGSGEITHKAVENYLSKGRRMQSEYVCKLLYRLYRRAGSVLARISGWSGAIPRRKHRRRVEIYEKRQFNY